MDTGPDADHLLIEVGRLWGELQRLDGGLGRLAEGLAGAVTAGGELRDVQEQLLQLQRTVGEFEQAMAAEQAQSATERAPWWPDLRGEDRAVAWTLLVTWIDEVLKGRHPQEYRTLSDCWFRHPDVVDELSALRVSWLAIYRARQPALPTAALEWHDRALPGVMTRVRRTLGSCKQSHQDPFLGLKEHAGLKEFIDEDVVAQSGP